MSSAKPRIRIVASNLHVGGGVQVAASLLDELAGMASEGDALLGVDCSIEVSPEVLYNLAPRTLEALNVEVRHRRPGTLKYMWHDLTSRYDVAFVVFGPHYFPLRASRVVMGYADVTSLYPSPVPLSSPQQVKRSIRGWLSRRIARRADALLVETPAIAERLVGAKVSGKTKIQVVPNSANAEVTSRRTSPSVRPVADSADAAILIYTPRAYPHKNLAFIPAVHAEAKKLGLELQFLVTLTEDEWRGQSSAFRAVSRNAGQVAVQQIAALHDEADAAFFPSLLEAQSATPLEALALGTPLFASDRDFVRTTCGDAAMYFDPLDPVDTATTIVGGLGDPSLLQRMREEGFNVIKRLPTPRRRAEEIWRLLKSLAEASEPTPGSLEACP